MSINVTLNSGHGDSSPLNGVRVLDLTRVLAGPLCTMMLGDLGANVIKVERPVVGDDTRGWGPPFDGVGRSAYFLSVNRNKLSVTADINAQADRDFILRLASDADVVVDNFRVGTLQARGIDPDAIVRSSSRSIWCTITGFGAGSARPGYDFVTQAECGWMAVTGEPSGEPMKVGMALADVIAGKDAAIAILAALIARGAGRPSARRLVISLIDSARASLINVAQNALLSGQNGKRLGNAHPNIVPYQLFHAADQPLVIAVGSDVQWLACVRALDLPDLADDPALLTNAGRLLARDRIVARMEAALQTNVAAHWLGRLEAAAVPAGVVKTVLEALAESGSTSAMGVPSSVGGSGRREPPLLDEHGAAIRESGWRVFAA
jgi:crotonobetainyl-CoA:carnitine CoA-transferase CaiB-like acyl-CoA transferase